jgi:uncharacterized protein YndB with AHSA1/START domain
MSESAPMVPFKVVSRRLFDFPPEALFDAFADQEALKAWWGPAGFTNTIETFDFRPGGAWRHTMHPPDGAAFANDSEFIEIDRPHRISLLHKGPMHVFTLTMDFIPRGSQTDLVWTMESQNLGENKDMLGFIETANQQNFDKLAALLLR